MKRLLLLLLMPALAPAEPIAYTGATLIDGTGGDPVENAVLLVARGRIQCVGDASRCEVADTARVVDLSNRWILPGLIDAHVHYGQTGWADGRPDALDVTGDHPYHDLQAQLSAYPDTWHRANLCAGVTAVFDPGGFPWSWQIRAGTMDAEDRPLYRSAGPLITQVEPPLSLPGENLFIRLTDETAGRDAVRYLNAFGSDAVKVWFIPVGAPAEQQRIDPLVLAVADEAHRQDIPLVVHATTLREAKVALRGKPRVLVHSVFDQPVDDEFIELARAADVIYTPTMKVSDGYLRMYRAAAAGEAMDIDDPNACVDPATRKKLGSTGRYGARVSARMNREQLAAYEARTAGRSEIAAANLRRVFEAGITVAMGTDAGNPGTLHGVGIYPEMEAMQAAGLSAADIIVMATRNGAKLLGEEDHIGTLEAGKRADFIVVGEDPLADIANLRTIEQVARNGRLHDIRDLGYPSR